MSYTMPKAAENMKASSKMTRNRAKVSCSFHSSKDMKASSIMINPMAKESCTTQTTMLIIMASGRMA